MPIISVVIPTFNREHTLRTAVQSVLAQTCAASEIIIVDDGSTDGTDRLVAGILRQQQHEAGAGPVTPIRYVQQANSGQSAARNEGCRLAQGDWIAFLDSDDSWEAEKLQRQLAAIERHGDTCGACFTNARLVDSNGLDVTAFERSSMPCPDDVGILPDAVSRLATRFDGIWVQTLMARKALIDRVGGFDVGLRFAEDHDFLFRLSLHTQFCYASAPLVVIDRTSRVSDPQARPRPWDSVPFRLRAEQQRLEKWLRMSGAYAPEIRRVILHNLRGVHSGWANWYLEGNEFQRARQASAQALRYAVTPQTALKCALISMAPLLAKRIAPRSANML